MNASAPASARLVQSPAPRERTRLWAALAALLFVPAAVVTGILTLASEQASRCVTYGEQCTPGLPSWVFEGSAGVGTVALLVALAAPAVRMRQAALTVQVLAEGTALLVILSHA
uniref:hypothetical protein n=1 Tax=Streptomyces sp. F8 TaxID=1436085 RepID=UPI0003D90D3F|nr:hypothetical protein [Streptomyces sp. F8]AHE39833.1 Hypothetical protein pFRL5_170 [Streptomyces sp. F8]